MKVSVALITYNHEHYVAQAIDSVLAQETDFEYEIVIGDDCSTDRTRAIVLEYQRRYPHKIRLVLPDTNLGMFGTIMFAQTIQAARGQNIALLDGDDYWTSSEKLQKQADFLDAHPECSMCFHNAQMIYEDGRRASYNHNSDDQKPISTVVDIIESEFIATCSAMFRRGLFGDLPNWFYSMLCADWALYILNAEHGTIGYIDEIMGVYRIHDGGVWSRLNELKQIEAVIDFYKHIDINLNYRYKHIIFRAISKYYYDMALAYKKIGNLRMARKFAVRSFVNNPFDNRISSYRFLTYLVNLHMESITSLIGRAARSVPGLGR